MIPFNIPLITGNESDYLKKVLESNNFSGDGPYTKKCNRWLEQKTGALIALLTTTCTHALEITSLLLNINPGDEVIMPSFTFVSTSNPFALRGAKIIFVDIRSDTMNIDETKIEAAITKKTKAIVPIHYGGIGSEMSAIMKIADKYQLTVIEDASQALLAEYKGKPLGSIGHMGCISFHDTKNIHCGEGGTLLINDKNFIERAEIIREKGTNRSRFLRGEINKYTWVDIGSSFLPSELSAAFLLAQLEQAETITAKRLKLWLTYYKHLKPLAEKELFDIPHVPNDCKHNGHIFYIKVKNIKERQKLIDFLKSKGISAVFHYIPLHTSKAGRKFGKFSGEDKFTTKESERLLRLPLFFDISQKDIENICSYIKIFFTDL